MNKVVRNAAYEAFVRAPGTLDIGTRIKEVRSEPLLPGGRVSMTLFETVAGGRPHPRMRIRYEAITDPSPPEPMFTPSTPPTSPDALRDAIATARSLHAATLDAQDLLPEHAPAQSPHYWRHQIQVGRRRALFQEIRRKVEAWLSDATLPAETSAACHRVIAQSEDEAYAGSIAFDDADTGTYHSYRNDAPFVHYLEAMLESLPTEGSAAMSVLHSSTRESVRRQRDQLQAHLDWLMRHKYAHEVIQETDIERTLGGLLIDRKSRRIVSEAVDTDPLAPRYELLRISPTAPHPHAGAWLYRGAEGRLFGQDHTPIDVAPEHVRRAPISIEQLTFRRAPGRPHLRPGLRFDWDGSGWVQQGTIDWVSWAGHCDIKAVMEQLGVTLTGTPAPRVEEHRSDTGNTTVYDRDLLLEMVASVMELGSLYRNIDGTGRTQRGIHHFGGSRNDSRPDRLQFPGLGRGRNFRWPMGGRREAFRVTSIARGNEGELDMGTAFFRYRPDLESISFGDNPHFIKTVEGDYNLIDVSGTLIEARVEIDAFDEQTGYPVRTTEPTVIDLRPEAKGRFFLGTHLDDVGRRELFRVYYEPENSRIVAEKETYVEVDGRWVAQPLSAQNVEIPLRLDERYTLSREMKRDDPSQFTALLRLASREARNICADTDKESAVWNGVVTHLDVTKLGANDDARTEHWRVDIKARFGEAQLEYLLRRDEHGAPEAYCPANADEHWGHWPDFLWHDIPDVGSKGIHEGDWIVNETMLDRQLVSVRVDESVPSGFYVYDDHIKNVFELIYAGLAGYTHTIVHNNKRYGFSSAEAWRAAVDRLTELRRAVVFADQAR